MGKTHLLQQDGQNPLQNRILLLGRAQQLILPEALMRAAVAANPWFTLEGIQLAFNALQAWFEPEALTDFTRKYPLPAPAAGTVGIITAGNIPFVGMHDVLMTFLAGRQAEVRCARQDALLLPWFWQTLLSGTAADGYIRFVPDLSPDISLVLATGGDHTARQLAWKYRNQHLLMRNNRFSVAVVLPGQLSPADWMALCDDLLLYNGLGCRNVSNLILVQPDGHPLVPEALAAAVEGYTSPTLSDAYRLARAYDRGRATLAEEPGQDTRLLRFVPSGDLRPMPPGQVAVIRVDTVAQAHALLRPHQATIQVVAGQEAGMVPLGKTQHPALDDFADGVDTFAALTAQDEP